MAEETIQTPTPPAATGPARSKDEIALELMKFVAVTTGYGKGGGSGAGYGTPKAVKTPEEQAEGLLELFQKCRTIVNAQD